MSPEDNRFYRELAEEPDEDFSAMHAALEPVAVAARPDHDGQVRLSMAISLKRIADALDNPNGSPNGDILHWLAVLASDANGTVAR